MKVIAINDAPIPENGYYSNGVYLDRAYYKGDIFDVLSDNSGVNSNGLSTEWTWQDEPSSPSDWLVIYHDKINAEMEVRASNFITLDEFRNKKINEILK